MGLSIALGCISKVQMLFFYLSQYNILVNLLYYKYVLFNNIYHRCLAKLLYGFQIEIIWPFQWLYLVSKPIF
ncbi:hypothetical protein CLU79DRAFT_740889 [Phycomyces nitens]|nr:hypothetical protein CLU79DRAFT_740889 [Phycomyces nitens]